VVFERMLFPVAASVATSTYRRVPNMVESSRTGRSGKSRRKVIPPPPTWPRGAATILHELSGPPGVLLWQLARDIKLWATAKEESRSVLFRHGSSLRVSDALASHAEVVAPVERVVELLRAAERVDPGELAYAAFQIARWAESRGLHSTPLEFAEAAGLADGGSADYAILAGRLARVAGENNRAVAWYGRAIGLSRGSHDAYVAAQLGYGEVLYAVGNYVRARQALRRASRMAIKYGRRGLAAQANHQLLLIACATGTFALGMDAAENALERYPVRHPRVPDLALAFAELLIGERYFSSAVKLLQQMIGSVMGQERVAAHGMLAWCYGALGDSGGFAASCDEVTTAAVAQERPAARGLVHVAAGALALGDRDELASNLAGEAVLIARLFGLRGVETDAADLLQEIARGLTRERAPVREASLPTQLLVAGFIRRLEKRRADA
jgi:tetratricopeptide (TPR) repeat protein